jgi:hypothetical protein
MNFAVQVSTLFRATTLATTLMDQYMKMTSSDFVRQAVQHGVHKIMELKHSCEVDIFVSSFFFFFLNKNVLSI